MLSPFLRILALPGALAFSSAAFVARLPISMVGLGIVLLVSIKSGSYGLAGAIAAVYVIANAGVGPAQGRLTDRFGQHVVLLGSITVFAAALGGLLVAVQLGWPTPVPHVLAALAGAGLPQVGSSVRARWTHLLCERPDLRSELHTAFALEAVIDEAVFIVGPVVVTLLATALDPVAGLLVAAAFGLTGTCWLAAQRRSEPPVDRQVQDASSRPALGWRLLLPLSLAAAALGMLFGSVEVVTVAFAEDQGHPGAVGWLLALWALGSLLAGVITGAVQWRSGVHRRFQLGMGALALTMLPLPFLPGLLLLGIALFVSGFAISPTLVATMSLVESSVPAGRLTEGIAWVTTGLSAGVAPGAAIAGRVVDAFGPSRGYFVAVVAGLFGVVVAASSRPSAATGRRGGLAALDDEDRMDLTSSADVGRRGDA